MSGRRVRAALHATGAIICVELHRWPSELALVRRTDSVASVTGDDAFDHVVELRDPLDTWRSMLTSGLREQLRGLFGSWQATLEEQTVTVELADDEVDELESVLDLCISLDVPSDAEGTEHEAIVFARAKEEPHVSVRLGHYRWLAARNWNAPPVYRTAAAFR